MKDICNSRKIRNMDKIKRLGIKCNGQFPEINENMFGTAEVKNMDETIARMICMHYASIISLAKISMAECPSDTYFSEDFLVKARQNARKFKVWNFMTEEERNAIEKIDDLDATVEPFMSESAYTLGWILGIIDKLPFPADVCDIFKLDGMLAEMDDFSDAARFSSVRNLKDVYDELDLNLRVLFEFEPHATEFHRYDCLSAEANPDIARGRISAINWYAGCVVE